MFMYENQCLSWIARVVPTALPPENKKSRFERLLEITCKCSREPWPEGLVGWSVSHTPKGCEFDPRWGHIREATDVSHVDVSLCPFSLKS